MSGDDPDSRDDGLAEAPPAAGFVAAARHGRGPFRHCRAPDVPRCRRLSPSDPRRQARRRGSCSSTTSRTMCCWSGSCWRGRSTAHSWSSMPPTPQDGLARLLRGGHDVALVEHRLGGEDGLSFTRAAGRHGVATPLILLSDSGVPGLDLAAIDAGAADFLDKEELAVERLERAIRMALARQRRSARLDAPPQIDPLTGLASRHAYLDRLERALGRARRRRDRAAVMLVDIDRFDAINRRFGHAAGDLLLRLIGGRIRRQLRETDTTARLDRRSLRPDRRGAGPPRACGHGGAQAAGGGRRPDRDRRRDRDGDRERRGGPVSRGRRRRRAACSPWPRRRWTRPSSRAGIATARRPIGNGRLPAGDAALAMALERAIRADELVLLFQPQVTLCSPDLGLAAMVRWPHEPSGGIGDERIRALAEAGGARRAPDRLAAGRRLPSGCALACRRPARAARRGAAPVAPSARLERSRPPARAPPRQRRHGAGGARAGDRRICCCSARATCPSGRWPPCASSGCGWRLPATARGPTSLAALRDLPLTTVKLARELLAGVPDDRRRTAVTGGVDPPGRRARPARRGRRRRDPGPAAAAAAAGLRRGPGPDLLPAAPGRGLRRLAAAGGAARLTPPPRQADRLRQLGALRSRRAGPAPARSATASTRPSAASLGWRPRPRDCGPRAWPRRARRRRGRSSRRSARPWRNSATPIESVTRPRVWPRSLSWIAPRGHELAQPVGQGRGIGEPGRGQDDRELLAAVARHQILALDVVLAAGWPPAAAPGRPGRGRRRR